VGVRIFAVLGQETFNSQRLRGIVMIEANIQCATSSSDGEFPKLMISTLHNDGRIVLFSESGKGTVLKSGERQDPPGNVVEYWNMSCFEDFTGTLELANGVA
jgi:hypothetical protein